MQISNPELPIRILNCQWDILNLQSAILNYLSAILNCQSAILNCISAILNCQLTILNCQLAILNCQSAILLELSIINCLSIWNLFMIIWKLLCSIGNCYCWLYFLYFPKLTYPMLVDMSFLKFISCCTFSILWGNDDTIESAFSLYSLSNIVTYTRKIILNCKSAILNYQWDILNCQVAILNCQSES